MEDHLKFPGGSGVLKAKFLEAIYENKLQFAGGGGVQNKKSFCGESMHGYFLKLQIVYLDIVLTKYMPFRMWDWQVLGSHTRVFCHWFR